ncbi:AMIN domain-containing protein [Oscillatoria sp. FACHB-1407]|uniref:AMIN domain-containing protein n=1 Tax=Oscillatoria sp. FACHB-1407 TaxID=2692847 RepID=UPI0016886411|nr:AMIN domain-containing protein [Oscillatoria sp. FACHB-1407]MBD2461094.1 AMIN domain-containing protein [Oscillatoria sp. FACHB-1407]
MQKAQFGQRFWLSLGLVGLSIVGNPVTIALGLGAIAITSAAPGYAATLTRWQFNANTSELEFTVPEGVTPRYFLLAQPARIVLDLPNTTVGSVPAGQTYSGQVRQIRVSEFQPGVTRIVIELSPDAVLAAQQVDLREVGQGRWVVRPRFAGDAPPVAAQPAPPPVAPAPQPSVQPAPLPERDPVAELSETVRDPVMVQPPAETAVTPAPSPTPAPAAPLPPLEPNATEIPVEIAEPVTPVAPPTATPEPTSEPTPEVASAPQPAPVETPSPTAPVATPSPEPYDPQLPTTLPPATLSSDRPVTVQVPALGSPPANRPTPTPPPVLQPAPVQPPMSSLPPASPTPNEATPPGVTPPATAPVAPPAPVAVAPNPNILLPSGTVLRLRYPRESVLELQAGSPWQEVLVLNQAVRDRAGNIIAPEGSPVIGRFETDQTGSRFVAQAITLQGRNIRLTAQSNRLGGDRQVSENQLVRNSAIGGLALTVLGAFTGIGAIAGAVVGATAGAATTYITAPQPAIIQPNQIVEVRLTEDLSRSQ